MRHVADRKKRNRSINLSKNKSIYSLISTLLMSMCTLFALPKEAHACTNNTTCSETDQFGSGSAITGDATVGGGVGVIGRSTIGYGVYGLATSSGIGVVGTSSSGWGVYGASAGVGVRAFSTGTDGIEASTSVAGSSAVYAHHDSSSSGFGVYAVAGGSSQAVHGDNTNSSGWAGFFNGKVFSSGGYSSSDARLKKDISDSRYGIDQVLKLRPVTFRWKKDNGNGLGLQVGLIAQEVQKVVPEVVDTDPTTGMMSINYAALAPIAIKAVQQQQAIIDRQEARIAALERARGPVMSSLLPSGLNGLLSLGLLLVALYASYRGRNLRSRS